jgi:hypothetical protein
MTCDANPHTPPELQIEFSVTLAEIRRPYLVEALADTVRTIKIAELDKGMGRLVLADALAKMAGHSLRAETDFPCAHPFRFSPRNVRRPTSRHFVPQTPERAGRLPAIRQARYCLAPVARLWHGPVVGSASGEDECCDCRD